VRFPPEFATHGNNLNYCSMRRVVSFSRLFSCANPAFVADYRRMLERPSNFSGRWIAVVVAIAAATWLCYAGVRHGLAGHYGATLNPDDWSRASHIEPGDAQNWYRLGRYRQLDFDHADIPSAISFYRRAVQLNPQSAFYKLDLASALEMSGNNAEAEQYYRGAKQNFPISAEVSWKYGNFLLRQQRLPEAYAEIHRAVEEDPKMLPLAISRVWHSNPDVHVLLDQALPNTAEGDWAALSFLTGTQDATAAFAVWNHLIARKPAIDWTKTFVLIDLLVTKERYDEAGTVWHESTDPTWSGSPESKSDSLIFDGGFEKDLSGGGFGWRQDNIPGAEFAFDTDEKHSGARSASITFDGTQNPDYVSLHQDVLVTPGTRYRFRGYLRTDKITTESGMRFEIVDDKEMKILDVFTANETGTQPWTLEETDFTTGPKTHLIRIRLRRAPSQRLDNRLSGTVWVDDVELFSVASTR
jgi:tetratricopeptide (TPR) repeat protein